MYREGWTRPFGIRVGIHGIDLLQALDCLDDESSLWWGIPPLSGSESTMVVLQLNSHRFYARRRVVSQLDSEYVAEYQ